MVLENEVEEKAASASVYVNLNSKPNSTKELHRNQRHCHGSLCTAEDSKSAKVFTVDILLVFIKRIQ